MSLFRYEAVDKTGRVVHGVMDAVNEQQVTQKLLQMGYTARAVYTPGAKQTTVQTAVPHQAVSQAQAPAAGGAPVSVKSCVPPWALANFFRQVATLVKSGIPLYQSFSDMAFTTRNRHLKKACAEMQQALQNGQKLSGAMAKFPHIFPVYTTASVWAGELTGKVDVALEEIATDLEREASDTRYGWIGWGLTKLTVVFCVFLLPCLNISKYLNAAFSNTTNEALKKMFTIFVASFFRALPIAIVVVAGFFAWGRLKHVPGVRRVLDSILLRMPVWGKLQRYRSMARFLHVLDSLYAAGISPATAWDAASLTARNNEIASKLRGARINMPNAERLSDMFQIAGVFESEDIGMATAGEKSGRLPETLGNLSYVYEDKAASLKTAGRIIAIHAIIISQILLTGVAAILMMTGYRQFLDPFLNGSMGP